MKDNSDSSINQTFLEATIASNKLPLEIDGKKKYGYSVEMKEVAVMQFNDRKYLFSLKSVSKGKNICFTR